MIAWRGAGVLSFLFLLAPAVLMFAAADSSGGEWRVGMFAAALSALVLAGVNLAVASSVNLSADGDWSGGHRANGTAMQSYTPALLAIAGAAAAAWLGPVVTWPVAAGLFVAGTVAYFAVPSRRRRPLRTPVINRRRAFATAHGLRFLDEVPGLSGRWDFGPFATGPDQAASLDRPTLKLKGHFAGMAGTHAGHPFTVVDAFAPEPWAVFRPWRQRHVTVCVIHITGDLPKLRVVVPPSRRRSSRQQVVYDTTVPRFAAAVATDAVVAEMAGQGIDTFEIQGGDVLVLSDEPLPDADAMAVVAALATVLSRIEANLNPWVRGAAAGPPIPPGTGRT